MLNSPKDPEQTSNNAQNSFELTDEVIETIYDTIQNDNENKQNDGKSTDNENTD